jgi:uncharacterized protein
LTTLTVYKLDHLGREIWQYPARVLSRENNGIRLEASFNRDDMDMGYAVFRRGDRFIETFYSDRWYNVFAVYDRESQERKGWYCNLCRPAEIGDTAVRCEDLALDVWVTPNREILIMDEVEYAEIDLAPHERQASQQALEELVELGKSGRLPG